MGLFDAISAGASGVLGFVGGALDRRSNKNLMREQMRWQSEESQKSRDWQSEESQKSRDWERKQWEDTNKYNSLSEVMKRISAAGANPFMLAGDAGSVGTGGFADVPTAGLSSSGASPSGVAPPYQGTGASWANSFSDIASSLESLANAKKLGVDTSFIEKSMKDALRKLKADADSSELSNDYQRVLNNYVDERNRKELDRLQKEIDNIASDTTLKDQQSWEIDQRINESKARVKDILASANLKKSQKKQIEKFTNNWLDKYYKSIVDLNKSSVTLNKAKTTEAYASAGELNTRSRDNISSANLKDALAATENTLRNEKRLKLKAERVISSLRANLSKASYNEDKKLAIKKATEQAKREGLITQQVAAELERAQAEGDWADVYYFFRSLHEGTSIGTDAVNSSANLLDAVLPF